MQLIQRNVLENQLNFLLSLEPETEVCSLCLFIKELHDKTHEFDGLSASISIQKIRLELASK